MSKQNFPTPDFNPKNWQSHHSPLTLRSLSALSNQIYALTVTMASSTIHHLQNFAYTKYTVNIQSSPIYTIFFCRLYLILVSACSQCQREINCQIRFLPRQHFQLKILKKKKIKIKFILSAQIEGILFFLSCKRIFHLALQNYFCSFFIGMRGWFRCDGC